MQLNSLIPQRNQKHLTLNAFSQHKNSCLSLLNFTLKLKKETAKYICMYKCCQHLFSSALNLFILPVNQFISDKLFICRYQSGSGIRFCCGFCLHILNELHVC